MPSTHILETKLINNESDNQLIRQEVKIGRNQLIKITNGQETKEIKYKKAKPMIDTGEWKII